MNLLKNMLFFNKLTYSQLPYLQTQFKFVSVSDFGVSIFVKDIISIFINIDATQTYETHVFEVGRKKVVRDSTYIII